MSKQARKMWWAAGCGSKKAVMRTESRMDVEDILKMKLKTIAEESDEMGAGGGEGAAAGHRRGSVKVRKGNSHVVKSGKIFGSKWSIKDSYVLLMNGFASRGGLGGIPRY